MNLYDKRFDYIENESDIVASFKDDGYELFEQNTTDCYEESSCVIKLKNQNKYYEVTVNVTMIGAWQDVGDKLYTIDSIDEVTYKEIEYDKLVSIFNQRVENEIKSLKNKITSLEGQIIS